MKALALRIGLYRVAAILIGGALLLELVRVQLLTGSTSAAIICTVGEVAFMAAAAGTFVVARRSAARPRSDD
jgi:hypothetical protein